MPTLKTTSILAFISAISFLLLVSIGFCGPHEAVTPQQAALAASTYRELGEAQYPVWDGAELVLERTYYDLDSETSAYEFAVKTGGESVGCIVIGGHRGLPPLIEFSGGPSPVEMAVDLGLVPLDALERPDSGGKWTPLFVGGFSYFMVSPDGLSELVDLKKGEIVDLSELEAFSDEFESHIESSSGLFCRMWDAALSGAKLTAETDYAVLPEALGFTWYRGCGPTSGTMVLAYYGNAGYRNLKYQAESFTWNGPGGTSSPYIPRELADMVADLCNVPREGGRVDNYGVFTGELAMAITTVAQSHGYKGFQCVLYEDVRDYSIYKGKIDEGDASVFGITKMDPGAYDQHAIMGCGYDYRNPAAGHLAVVFDTWTTSQRTAAMEYFITYRLLTVHSPLVSEQDVELSADSHNYGNVNMGSSSDWVTRISNTGAIPLLINSITSDDPSFYVTTPQFPTSIGAGNSIYVNIRFSPDRATRILGTLTIETDDPDPNEEFCTIALQGRGLDNSAPIVRCAGVVGDHLSSGEAGYVTVRADVQDPDGQSEIESVFLFVGTLEDGQLTSLELLDDGQHGDDAAGDGLFANQFWVDSAPEGVYVFEIVAEDTYGAVSNVWPYMTIDSSTRSANNAVYGIYQDMGTSGDPSVANIYMAGFYNTSISQEEGGKLVCVADIDDYLDGSSIDRAELRFQGSGVGVELRDDGLGDDEAAGDERFTGSMTLGPGYPAGDYLLEIVAIDGTGRECVPFPFYVVR